MNDLSSCAVQSSDVIVTWRVLQQVATRKYRTSTYMYLHVITYMYMYVECSGPLSGRAQLARAGADLGTCRYTSERYMMTGASQAS